MALDRTKLHAKASRHSALSYERASQIETQWQAEVAELMTRAEVVDQTDAQDGMSTPQGTGAYELGWREHRLTEIVRARAMIEARAKERQAREQADHDALMAARAAKTSATGKKPGSRPPTPPMEGPDPADQVNLTDEASRIMPVAGCGFEQSYNAQAPVAVASLLVVATDVVQATNHKRQVEPMLGHFGALPAELGQTETLLADTGYFSAANVQACVAAQVDPLIAMGRQPHYPPLAERLAPAPPPPDNPTPVEAVALRLKTTEGRKLYGLRKQTPEPVFGIFKSALRFRQFLRNGLENVAGEWSLVTMAWNLERMFVLAGANRAMIGAIRVQIGPSPVLLPRLRRRNSVDQPSRPRQAHPAPSVAIIPARMPRTARHPTATGC